MSNEDPIMTILRVVRDDVKDVKRTVDTVNREMGAVQSVLKNLNENDSKHEREISLIRQTQLTCVAKSEHPSVIGRIEKIESQKTRDEITGQIEIMARSRENGSHIPFGKSMIRMIPWLIMTALSGAAVAGYLLATRM